MLVKKMKMKVMAGSSVQQYEVVFEFDHIREMSRSKDP